MPSWKATAGIDWSIKCFVPALWLRDVRPSCWLTAQHKAANPPLPAAAATQDGGSTVLLKQTISFSFLSSISFTAPSLPAQSSVFKTSSGDCSQEQGNEQLLRQLFKYKLGKVTISSRTKGLLPWAAQPLPFQTVICCYAVPSRRLKCTDPYDHCSH